MEYALRDIHKPMGVNSFITKDIPVSVQSQLPTVQEIESELTALRQVDEKKSNELITRLLPSRRISTSFTDTLRGGTSRKATKARATWGGNSFRICKIRAMNTWDNPENSFKLSPIVHSVKACVRYFQPATAIGLTS